MVKSACVTMSLIELFLLHCQVENSTVEIMLSADIQESHYS